MAEIVKVRPADHPDVRLLLSGIVDGYPLPSQHPAHALGEGNRFWVAVIGAAAGGLIEPKFDSGPLVITPAGRLALNATPQDGKGGEEW